MICLICQGRSAKEIGPLTLRRLAAEHCTYMLMVFNRHHKNDEREAHKGLHEIARWMNPDDMVNVPTTKINPLKKNLENISGI